MSTPATVVFESGQRLSQSRIWQLQRAFFTQAGIDAWGSATVPHYITCNAFIAEAYARVVLGWLRDCINAEMIDDAQPIYLAELGAGSGRFAYLFLHKLWSLLASSPLKELRLVYVMTDFSDESLVPWRQHPSLQPFVKSGRLDFARYDVERDESLFLVESGQTLSAGAVVNPMVVLANYYFDSIPQDGFYEEDGKFSECLVRLCTETEESDPNDVTILKRLEVSYDDRALADNGANYYGDAELDKLLATCRSHVTKGSVRFPTAALRCLRVFSALCSDRWLLLSGDKGFVHDEALDGRDRPGIAIHGSFSMDVNYHALGEFFRGRGGHVMTMDHRHNSLNVVAMALGAGDQAETRAAYASHIESFGPDDYFIVRKTAEKDDEEMTLVDAMALMRLGRNDPRMLRQLLPVMRKRVPKASALQKRELLRLVDRAWALHFHIGEEHDLPFAVGVLMIDMKAYERAHEAFTVSWGTYCADSGTAYNLALASYRLKRRDEAQQWARKALAIDSEHASAKRLLADIEVDLSAEPG